MNLQNFRFETGADGVAVLTWDMPDRSMNVITEGVIDEIALVVEHVVATPEIKGCVITSGKPAFSGGADLSMLQKSRAGYEQALREKGFDAANRLFFEASRRLSQLYRRLETCGKPFAAAINGVCLGGAFELALACHYRVLADNDNTKVGLPEIQVGLFPGAGGTQRVARLLPTGDALQFLAKGQQVPAKAAKAAGLAHELSPQNEIVGRAAAWIASGGSAVAPWDQKGFKPPSGRIFSPGGMMIWPPANAIYRRETYDNYPAAKAILHAVYEGLQLPMDQALTVESRWFAHILRSKEAAAMIRTLFLSKGELEKGARRPKTVPPTTLKKIGILGAGFMGAGVGYVSATAGLEVVLIDRDQESADKGRAAIDKLISGQVSRGKATAAEKEALLARVTATPDYARLSGCDLILEAVFEDRAVKADATRKAQEVVGADVVFASNTSTLPITSLAETSLSPKDFIGVHFFSPVEKMMLVEIIRGEATGDKALATALDFVRLIKKTPIVVNDSRGFFANRCVLGYVREGAIMLLEGVPPAMIENVARMAGMPVGPLSLNDEVGLDLGWKILQATKKDLGPKAVDPAQEAVLAFMVEKNARFGRKNGKGFYDYPTSGKKTLWPGLSDATDKRLNPDTLDVAELKQRFLVAQAVEAARTVADHVIVDPREADVGSILGFGFAPFTGGALSYIDGMGVAAFVALCDALAKKHGARFSPPQLLRDMAQKGESFYGNAGARAAAA
ncbi:MAG TPA: 3-hydroxyacyl-CoA dehydrogenase NAD-binding domain-containing protein [Methylocystis sp.]|nr:3-hydroxyacyl-CoA dehydrogenase NAD-binding domain-containing protein [Methylocystis sp.]